MVLCKRVLKLYCMSYMHKFRLHIAYCIYAHIYAIQLQQLTCWWEAWWLRSASISKEQPYTQLVQCDPFCRMVQLQQLTCWWEAWWLRSASLSMQQPYTQLVQCDTNFWSDVNSPYCFDMHLSKYNLHNVKIQLWTMANGTFLKKYSELWQMARFWRNTQNLMVMSNTTLCYNPTLWCQFTILFWHAPVKIQFA